MWDLLYTKPTDGEMMDVAAMNCEFSTGISLSA